MKRKLDQVFPDHYDEVEKRVKDEIAVCLVRHGEMSPQQVHDNLTAIPDDVLYQVVSLLPFADRHHLQQSCRKLYSLSKQPHFYRGLDRLNIEYSSQPNFCLFSAQELVARSCKCSRYEYSLSECFNLVTLAAPHLSALSFDFIADKQSNDHSEDATDYANLIATIFEHMAAHWPHVIHEVAFDLSVIINFNPLNLLMQECSLVRQMQESLARFPNLRRVVLKSYRNIKDDWECNACKEFIAGAFPHLSDVTFRCGNEYNWIHCRIPLSHRDLLPPVEQLTLQMYNISDKEFENLERILRLRRLHFRKCHGLSTMSRTYHFPHLTKLTYEESVFRYRNNNLPTYSKLAFYDVIEAPNLRHLRLTASSKMHWSAMPRNFAAFLRLDWDRIGQMYPLLESIAVTINTVSVWLLGRWPFLPTYTDFVQDLLECASRLPHLTLLHMGTCGMLDNADCPALTESVWRDMLDALQVGCPNLQSIRLPFLCERLYVDWLLGLFQACRSLRRIHCDALCAAGVGWTESNGAQCQQFITYLAESLHNTSVVLSGSFFVGFPGLSQSMERLPLTEKFPSVMVIYTGQCHIHEATANVIFTRVQ